MLLARNNLDNVLSIQFFDVDLRVWEKMSMKTEFKLTKTYSEWFQYRTWSCYRS